MYARLDVPPGSLSHHSEINSQCTDCASSSDEIFFVQLEEIHRLSLRREGLNMPYVFSTVHVPLDTATQHVWTMQNRQSENARLMAFMELSCWSADKNTHEVQLRIISVDIEHKQESFVEEKKIQYKLQRGNHRVVFGLHIPVAAYKMDFNRVALVGVCYQNFPDSITLLVFNLFEDVISAIEVQDCIDCCQEDNIFENTLAHYDVVFHTLYIATKQHIYYTAFLDTTHTSINAIKLTVPSNQEFSNFVFVSESIIKSPDRELNVQIPKRCLSGLTIFFLLDKRDYANTKLVALPVRYCSVGRKIEIEVDSNTYSVFAGTSLQIYFTNSDVLKKLTRQKINRHFPQSDETITDAMAGVADVKMTIASFAILNNRRPDTTTHLKSSVFIQKDLDLIVMHQANPETDETSYEQIISRVTVNGVSTTVEILATVFKNNNKLFNMLYYSVIPFAVATTEANHIMAKSVVGITYHTPNTIDFVFYNFSCFSCARAISDTSAAHHNCPCTAGTAPVCVPCGLDCDSSTYIAGDGISDAQCFKASLVNYNSRQKFNFYCLPCAGSIFCLDGTVAGVKQCPAETPYSVNPRSSTTFDCVCNVSQTPVSVSVFAAQGHTMMHHMNNNSIYDQGSACRACTSTELCTPLYSGQQRNIQCPVNTIATVKLVLIEDSEYVEQVCACVPG